MSALTKEIIKLMFRRRYYKVNTSDDVSKLLAAIRRPWWIRWLKG
jgi:hypothetical protein